MFGRQEQVFRQRLTATAVMRGNDTDCCASTPRTIRFYFSCVCVCVCVCVCGRGKRAGRGGGRGGGGESWGRGGEAKAVLKPFRSETPGSPRPSFSSVFRPGRRPPQPLGPQPHPRLLSAAHSLTNQSTERQRGGGQSLAMQISAAWFTGLGRRGEFRFHSGFPSQVVDKCNTGWVGWTTCVLGEEGGERVAGERERDRHRGGGGGGGVGGVSGGRYSPSPVCRTPSPTPTVPRFTCRASAATTSTINTTTTLVCRQPFRAPPLLRPSPCVSHQFV